MADGTTFSAGELDLGKLNAIEGWLSNEARDLSISIMRGMPHRPGLEIGVHCGRFLALMAAHLHQVIGIDALLDGEGQPLPEEYRQSAVSNIIRNVATITSNQVEVWGSFSQDVRPADLLSIHPDGYGFVHVDGSHEADVVAFDLRLADAVLADDGVIAADDVYNAVTPGVGEGFFSVARSLSAKPFAVLGNKVFLAKNPPRLPSSSYGTLLGCRVALDYAGSNVMPSRPQ